MTITEFRFDGEGNLVELRPTTESVTTIDEETAIDLRSDRSDDAVDHLVQLSSGEVATVRGANAYQPEGPMTTFFSTGSSRGTIDSWSVRVASYRTADIVSIQRGVSSDKAESAERPSLVAV